MPVRRFVADENSRRARAVVSVTIGRGLPFGSEEIAALDEGCDKDNASKLDQQMAAISEYMLLRGWPDELGGYWSTADGSRWQKVKQQSEGAPDWAHCLTSHPGALFPERSPEWDAYSILRLCEKIRQMMKAGTPVTTITDSAIELGMLMGRDHFEAQFGRACDVGIGRILSGRKGGRAYADTKEFQRDQRLGALQRAIDANPNVGPSELARQVSRLWPDSEDKEAAALKFYRRYKEKLRHEILMS